MKYGIMLPSRGDMARPENIVPIARKAEELGFAVMMFPDHIILPNDVDSPYPYTQSGVFPGTDTNETVEQLTMLAYLAGQTESIRLVTSVMIVPHRPPVLTAKVLATIDVLSNGRLDVGCGVGWMREEFEAIGTPPYEERGAVGDEYIRAFKELWTSDDPSFDGKYCKFSDVTFLPRPVQKPHPPIWIGGESPPALRRAGRLGDGWHPIGENPRYPVGTPEALSQYLSRVHGHAREADRDPSQIAVAYSAMWYTEQAQTLPSGERRAFTGSAEQIADDVREWRKADVRRLMINFFLGMDSVRATLDRMEHFAAAVMPISRA